MSDMTQNTASADSLIGDSDSQEFLAFKLGGEEYGIEILQIQEIRNFERLTVIASAPAYMKGVMNLRGVIVPVIDLRLYFELNEAVYDDSTAVIILMIKGKTIGMVVDGVSDVITLKNTQIKPAPSMGNTFSSDYLLGLGSIEQRMVILVDIEKVLTDEKLGLITS